MSFKRMFEKKEIEKIVEEHSGGSELYKHVLTWNRMNMDGDAVEEQYYNTVVDNYPTAYTESTLIEKRGPKVSFVAINQAGGPPGNTAVFGNRFKVEGGGDTDSYFYGFFKEYGSSISNEFRFILASDTVTTF